MSAPRQLSEPDRPRVIRLITALTVPRRTPEGVAPDSRLIEDLGFDSMRLIELTMALERTFGLPRQPPESLVTVTTVDDVVAFIRSAAKDPL